MACSGWKALACGPAGAASRDRGGDAGPWVGRLHGRVRAEGQQRAGTIEVGQREGVAGPGPPGLPDGRRVTEQVAGLHGGSHTQGREPGHVGGVDELGVLHAMPGARHGRHRGQDVQHGAHGPVADGVDLAGDAGRSGASGQLRQLWSVAERHPGRAARRWTGRVVSLVGRQQGGRPAAQRTIGEELQPAVAITSRARVAFPEAGPEAHLDGPLQLLLANAGHDPQRQAPGRGERAVERRSRAQLGVRGDAARIVHRGDAQTVPGRAA